MFRMGKKGLSLGDLVTVTLSFVLIGVVGAIGTYINSQVNTTAGFAAGSAGALAISNATAGISTLMQWLPIIAIVLASGIVITVLVTAFAVRQGGGV